MKKEKWSGMPESLFRWRRRPKISSFWLTNCHPETPRSHTATPERARIYHVAHTSYQETMEHSSPINAAFIHSFLGEKHLWSDINIRQRGHEAHREWHGRANGSAWSQCVLCIHAHAVKDSGHQQRKGQKVHQPQVSSLVLQHSNQQQIRQSLLKEVPVDSNRLSHFQVLQAAFIVI